MGRRGDLGEIVNYLDVVWGILEISSTDALQHPATPCNGALQRRGVVVSLFNTT